MTALSSSLGRMRKPFDIYDFPVGSTRQLYKGSAVCLNTSGYAAAAADTACFRFAGISEDEVLGDGSNGTYNVRTRRNGIYAFAMGSTFTQAHMGLPVCISDDDTVDLPWKVTNRVYAGVLVAFDSSFAYVDIYKGCAGGIVERHVNMNLAASVASTTHKITGYVVPAGRAAILMSAKYSWSTAVSRTTCTLDLKKYVAGSGTAMVTQVDINAASTPAVDVSQALTPTATLADRTMATGDIAQAEIATGSGTTAAGANINVSAIFIEY